MPNPQTIVGLELLPSGDFLVKDWKGRDVEVKAENLASHCAGLLNDTELPEVEVLTPGHASLVEVGTRLILPEELREYSGPLARAAEFLWKQVTAPQPRRAPPEPPRSPPPPPGAAREPSREAPRDRPGPRVSPAMARRRGGMVG